MAFSGPHPKSKIDMGNVVWMAVLVTFGFLLTHGVGFILLTY